MYQHILVPTDGTPFSANALRKSVQLARTLKGRITALTVIEPFHVFAIDPEIVTATPAQYGRRMAERAGRFLAVARDEAAAAGVPCTMLQVEDEHPWRAIVDTAVKEACDLIAMPSHGRRGLSAVILGSETVKVLTHSPVPVLVYR